MGSTDESNLPTGYEPKNYELMETYVESLAESLTQPQFPEQRFVEDVDYDDTALQRPRLVEQPAPRERTQIPVATPVL